MLIMNSLSFNVQDNNVFVESGGGKKEISKEVLLEICHLLLGNIAEPRDYTSITSVKKLLRVINVECQPDDSEDEGSSEEKPKTTTAPKRTGPVRRGPAVKKPPPQEESSDDSEDE